VKSHLPGTKNYFTGLTGFSGLTGNHPPGTIRICSQTNDTLAEKQTHSVPDFNYETQVRRSQL
jgi:hypothetical protein